MCLHGPTGGPLLPMPSLHRRLCSQGIGGGLEDEDLAELFWQKTRSHDAGVCRTQAGIPIVATQQRRALAGLTGRLPFSLPPTDRSGAVVFVFAFRRRLSV
jgi:hypothetical protein